MTRNYIRWTVALAMAAASFTSFGHGDEPHGDEPHPAGVAAGVPRFEAATEGFEMTGRLEDNGLTVFINRFETSEPVLQAKVELESGTVKAVGAFQADQGSYVVKDETFLRALNRPGAHPLVVTVTAGNEADLLEATLTVAARQIDRDDEGRAPMVPAIAGALGVAVLGAGALTLRRRRAVKGQTQ
jgi:hypothetical protein